MTPSGLLVGILGGMGPAATVDFYAKLIRATPAETDQDHLRVVVWADPRVPDRSASLLDDGADPAPLIEAGVQALKDAGADLIAIPCNTAHAFIDGVAERCGVPIVHMIEETARRIAQFTPRVERVALLATSGTVGAGLYQDWIGRTGRDAMLPNADEQAWVASSIRDIKAGETGLEVRIGFAGIVEALAARGAQAVIAGCTEIPLVLHDGDVSIAVVDPAQILAEAVVARTTRRNP